MPPFSDGMPVGLQNHINWYEKGSLNNRIFCHLDTLHVRITGKLVATFILGLAFMSS